MGFKDHFSRQAGAYMAFRPDYPAMLFEFLASLPDRHERVWDCGTGNGQAALGLAPHFDQVLASDASADQIAKARSHPKVSYFVAPAEQSGLESASIDLVLVAQAVHWFDFDKFYAEVRRVAVPGGMLALVSYHYCAVEAGIDALVNDYTFGTLDGFWPPERAYIDTFYRDIPFPFEELEAPVFVLEMDWDLARFLGYLSTWSATEQYRRQKGTDPMRDLIPELERAWGPGSRSVRWPLFMRAGRVHP